MSVGLQTTKVHDVGSVGLQKTEQTAPKTDGIKVGKQDNAQAAQQSKALPGLKAALGNNCTTSDVLSRDQFSTALSPSKGFKAKAAFVGFFQKILPNSLASRIGQDSATPLRDARQALASYHTATTPGEKESALTTLRDALGRLPETGVRNRAEVLNVVEGELKVIDLGKRMEALKNDNSPTAAGKHLDIALELLQIPDNHRMQSVSGNFTPEMELQFQDQIKQAETKGKQSGDTSVHQRLMTELQNAAKDQGTAHLDAPQQLFRENNEHSALLRATNYSSVPPQWGRELSVGIEQFDRHGKFLEVNPEKISPQDIPQGSTAQQVATENAKAMLEVFSRFMDQIGVGGDALKTQVAVDKLPQELCDSMRAVYEGLKETHGEKEALKQVGSNTFLRMICPMMVAPKGGTAKQPFQVTSDPISPATQKNLILLSKIVQNSANQVEFGAKEQSMLVFNDSVKDHFDGISLFARMVVERGRPANEI